MVYVIGQKAPEAPPDIIDIIERRPVGKTITMVRYKGRLYPVIGRRGNERIFVGIRRQASTVAETTTATPAM